jgi:hypothetical protein
MNTDSKYYQTEGKLRYSQSSGWIILDISPTVQEYYYAVIKKYLHLTKVNKPYYAAHITVVAGKYEAVLDHPLWNKHNEETVTISYDSFVRNHDMYFWLHVESETLINVRRELGLSDFPKYPFHLTIANLKNCA